MCPAMFLPRFFATPFRVSLMPNPKRRHSKSRKRLRRTHDALPLPALTRCAKCNATKRPHTVCENCGYYAEKDILARDSG